MQPPPRTRSGSLFARTRVLNSMRRGHASGVNRASRLRRRQHSQPGHEHAAAPAPGPYPPAISRPRPGAGSPRKNVLIVVMVWGYGYLRGLSGQQPVPASARVIDVGTVHHRDRDHRVPDGTRAARRHYGLAYVHPRGRGRWRGTASGHPRAQPTADRPWAHPLALLRSAIAVRPPAGPLLRGVARADRALEFTRHHCGRPSGVVGLRSSCSPPSWAVGGRGETPVHYAITPISIPFLMSMASTAARPIW